MTTKPRNTKADAATQAGGLLMLADMMFGAGGSSGAILRQEAQGQADLVASESLPSQGSYDPAWAAMGVTFGEPFPHDPLFRSATLPKGWAKRGTDHSMWSDLVDDRGRKRASVFYKAAFYDRSAHMRVAPRFSTSRDYDEKTGEATHATVTDCGAAIERFEIVSVPGEKSWERGDAADKAATAWLDANRPEWRSVTAYWDEP